MLKKTILVLLAFLFAACGHTNNLEKYVLRGKKALYNTKISFEARTIEVNIEKGIKNKKKKSDFDKILEISSDIASAGKISTLKDYVDTETLAYNITAAMENALITFLDIETAERIFEKPDFIVRINLKHCVLQISPSGSTISIFVTADIVNRISGDVIWENWETYVISVGPNSDIDKIKVSDTEKKIANAIQLLSMSKEEIQDYVNYLAEAVGEKMAETFKEDYNEAVKNKVFEN